MILLRRLLLLATFCFWQGGFTFYAAVVVPVGRQVLGSHVEQGMITRHVAFYLNVAGGVALVFMAWETMANRGAKYFRVQIGCWLVLAVSLAVLITVHPLMDSYLQPDEARVLERPTFRFWHHVYLNTATLQWAVALVFVWATVSAWRNQDSAAA